MKMIRPLDTVYLSTRSKTIGLISSNVLSNITRSMSVAVMLKNAVPPGVCSNRKTMNSSSEKRGGLSLMSVNRMTTSALAVAPSGVV